MDRKCAAVKPLEEAAAKARKLAGKQADHSESFAKVGRTSDIIGDMAGIQTNPLEKS
jgi:hypothetical protein